MITFTELAKNKVSEILKEENDSTLKLRLFIKGGGCSGLQYQFGLAEEQNSDDFELFNVLIDSISAQYLEGAVIDYKDDLEGSGFSIQNPNATTTCGCGSSFSTI